MCRCCKMCDQMEGCYCHLSLLHECANHHCLLPCEKILKRRICLWFFSALHRHVLHNVDVFRLVRRRPHQCSHERWLDRGCFRRIHCWLGLLLLCLNPCSHLLFLWCLLHHQWRRLPRQQHRKLPLPRGRGRDAGWCRRRRCSSHRPMSCHLSLQFRSHRALHIIHHRHQRGRPCCLPRWLDW